VSVLVDTPIWSLALRRKPGHLAPDEKRLVEAWAELIRERQVLLIGCVRQEVLSGIREPAAFEKLRSALRSFPDEPLTTEDYEEAARCGDLCRGAGIAGSAADFLLCAVALRREASIFTADADFARYALHLPIRLYR
jgi:predicted nucleic acid-binding protein